MIMVNVMNYTRGYLAHIYEFEDTLLVKNNCKYDSKE